MESTMASEAASSTFASTSALIPSPPTLVTRESGHSKLKSKLAAASKPKRRFTFFPSRHSKQSSSTSKLPSSSKTFDQISNVDEAYDDEDDESGDEERLRSRITARLQRALARSSTHDSASDTPRPSNEFSILIKDLRTNVDEEKSSKDIYRWAILWENQRGITLFGVSSYSASSLFPHDPPPFTIPLQPGNDDRHSMHTPHTLFDYQPPDATWFWVSKTWLVQMGGNGSSHDGFEYNWCFRRKGWRSAPGMLNSGGWVRRRQWVRLMVRPADPKEDVDSLDERDSSNLESWSGDVEKDWARCRLTLHGLGTDGRRIAMWRHWLASDPASPSDAFDSPSNGNRQRTEEDAEVDDGREKKHYHNHPRRKCMTQILSTYTSEVLLAFIYPESRARFVRMLEIQDVNIPPLRDALCADFWSFRQGFTIDPYSS